MYKKKCIKCGIPQSENRRCPDCEKHRKWHLKLKEGEYIAVYDKDPYMYSDYLVKTSLGTYEFAHFACGEWKILGDNGGESNHVEYWCKIPLIESKHEKSFFSKLLKL